ncbi:MAG TPA: glycosyl hydrolase family 65 protein [Terriglobales bacterium]
MPPQALSLPGFRSEDPAWLLRDEGFTLTREHEIESLFAIANGYIGNRGSLAEGSPLSAPATFVAGVFEQLKQPGAVPELMVLPDWTGVRIWIDHHALDIQHGNVLEHRRILDMQRGVFWREWRHCDPAGRITRIVSFRLASMADRHLLLHSVTLVPENYTSVVRFESSMEVTEGEVSLLAPEWKVRANSLRPNMLPLAVRAPGRETVVVFGVTSQVLNSNYAGTCRRLETREGTLIEHCEAEVKAGAQCHLHRLISVFTSRESSNPFKDVSKHLSEVLTRPRSELILAHASQWKSYWGSADIEIDGDDHLQRALRFAGYHLISAADPNDGRVSIGARALTGAAYKGHVFWDTEIYMLPFFTFTNPPAARALLEYRYHTLGAARQKARDFGFRGAMYPWESADTGEETTPKAVIAPSGEVLIIRNGELEVHIVADVAFGVWQYWRATWDDDFFLNCGAEIVLETARFWASRGTLEKDGCYHIRHVIGPDEYHEDVDDNAYTNLMAAWNLRHGAETARLLQERWPERWADISGRLHMGDEVSTWEKLADAMFIPFDSKTLLYEQFAGYFGKEQIDLRSYEPRSAAMDMILGHERIQRTNVVKQADVVLANYLLEEEMSAEVRTANFRYYEPRTGHGSSLSPCIHSLIAARIGDLQLAQKYLQQAAEIDLGNNMGNAAGGVHAAALGGLWQAMVFGFAGVRIHEHGISFFPRLLSHWRRLAFPLEWRGRKLRVSIEPRAIRVAVSGSGPINLAVEGASNLQAEPGNEYTTEQSEPGWEAWRQAARKEAV